MTEQEWLTSTDPAAMIRRLQATPGYANDYIADLRHLATDRKLRLFACAMWDDRSSHFASPSPTGQEVYELALLMADGEAPDENRPRPVLAAGSEFLPLEPEIAIHIHRMCNGKNEGPLASALLRDIFGNPFAESVTWLKPGDRLKMLTEPSYQLVPAGERDRIAATFLRIEGDAMVVQPANAVRGEIGRWPIPKPDWLTPNVLAVAQTIYEERRFADMPILADALEEAGCTNEAILNHCRGLELCWGCRGDRGWQANSTWVPCEICDPDFRDGVDSPWMPKRGPHVRGCWVLDLILGKS